MKSVIIVISAILLVAALAEGASIHLREKRHHVDVIDPGFSADWHDQFRPDNKEVVESNAESQAGAESHGFGNQGGSGASSGSNAKAEGQGHGGGSQASSNAGSSAQGSGFGGGSNSWSNSGSSAGGSGAAKTSAESKSQSFVGGNGSYSSSSSSSSSSAGGGHSRPHLHQY